MSAVVFCLRWQDAVTGTGSFAIPGSFEHCFLRGSYQRRKRKEKEGNFLKKLVNIA